MADEKKPGFFKRIASGIKRFFKDTKSELKKVVWPSKKTVLNNTTTSPCAGKDFMNEPVIRKIRLHTSIRRIGRALQGIRWW